MKFFKLSDMTKGWLVGDFFPSVIRTKDFEVAIHYHKAGETTKRHIHKIAKEITAVVEGKAIINNKEFNKGDIILLEPNEPAEFKAIVDTALLIVKIPSATNDKYFT